MIDATEHTKEHLIRELVASIYGVIPNSITDDGLDLSEFHRNIDFSSGNETELKRYFNTKISTFMGSVSLSFDVKPKYWPASFNGFLYLKCPTYVSTYDYSSVGVDKLTATWGWSITERIIEVGEENKIQESVNRQNEHIFDRVMTNLSWSNYAGKFHTNFSGALKIDASRLKDLKGIPEMVEVTQPLMSLIIENWCGKTLDLSGFKFNELELYECKFDEIIGLPDNLDKLTIRNAGRYTPILSLDECKFVIKFPQQMDSFLCYNDTQGDGILPLFDFGKMTVAHKLYLKNINAIGSVSLSSNHYIINILGLGNINQGYARKYDKDFDIAVYSTCAYINVENTKTPVFKDFEDATYELILSGITDELLTDDSLPPATSIYVFKDCSSSVINLLSAKSGALKLDSPYPVIIDGLQQDGDAVLDLRGFKDALFVSANGGQYDESVIGRSPKKLQIKYPQWSKTNVAKEDINRKQLIEDCSIDDWFISSKDENQSDTKISDLLGESFNAIERCLKTNTPICLIHNFFDCALSIEAEDVDLEKTRLIVEHTVLDNPAHLMSKKLYDNGQYGIEKFVTILFSSLCVDGNDRAAFEEYIKTKGFSSFLDGYLDKLLVYLELVYQASGKLTVSIEDKLDGAITVDVARSIIDRYEHISNRKWFRTPTFTITDVSKVAEAYHTALLNVSSRVVSSQMIGGF